MKKQRAKRAVKRTVLFLNIEDANEEHVDLVRRAAITLGMREIVASSDGGVDNVPSPDVPSWLDTLKGFEISGVAYAMQRAIWREVYTGPDYSNDPGWYEQNLFRELTASTPCKLWPQLEFVRYMMRRLVTDSWGHDDDQEWVQRRLEALFRKAIDFFETGQIDDKIDYGPVARPCVRPRDVNCIHGGALIPIAK